MNLFTSIRLWGRRFFVAALLLSTIGCASNYKNFSGNYMRQGTAAAPDYNDLYYWAAHPQKRDVADSIPADIDQARDSIADVFFIHPTTYTGNRNGWNADVHDGELNAKTDYTSILFQATAFNRRARVFAPRYRQVHLSAFYTKDSAALAAFDTAYADVRRAFLQFQKQAQGRPVVIAAHSQGAFMSIKLLQEFFDGTPLQQQLVAAYVVGWPVMPSNFKSLQACSTPAQTGCVCSWRTFKQGFKPDYVLKEKETAWVVNPLSWTNATNYVSRTENKGSILRRFNQLVPQTTDAQIAGGVLWANRPKFAWSFLFRTNNYHIGDINLYYMNVRENVARRIEAYEQKGPENNKAASSQ